MAGRIEDGIETTRRDFGVVLDTTDPRKLLSPLAAQELDSLVAFEVENLAALASVHGVRRRHQLNSTCNRGAWLS